MEFSCQFPVHLGYEVWMPEDAVPGEKLPLVVFLHGVGERGNGTDELPRASAIALPKFLKDGTLRPHCAVLIPQCPADKVWNQIVFPLKELIDRVILDYPIDKDRVSITGLSMGGFGTWETGITFPGLFSAMAPICGGGMSWRTSSLAGMPIWAFHGSADPVVFLAEGQQMVNGARKAGANVKFTIFENVGHASWDAAYLDTRLLDWLIAQKRSNRS